MKLASIVLAPEHYIVPYNIVRRNKILLISTCLDSQELYEKMKSSERLELCAAVERVCYNIIVGKGYIPWQEAFTSAYESLTQQISLNIDKEITKQDFGKAILSGEIKIDDDLPNVLVSSENKEILSRIEYQRNLETKVKYSTMHTCSKCKNEKTTEQRHYNRSLDEAVNILVTCLACGYRWKSN